MACFQFKIEKSLDNINWSTQAIIDGALLTYTVPSVVAGTTYYFRLTTIAGSNSAGPSNTATLSCSWGPPPGPPSNLRTVCGDPKNQVKLYWTPADSLETEFRIYQGILPSSRILLATVAAGVTQYIDTSATLFIDRLYSVTAKNLQGESDPSNGITRAPFAGVQISARHAWKFTIGRISGPCDPDNRCQCKPALKALGSGKNVDITIRTTNLSNGQYIDSVIKTAIY